MLPCYHSTVDIDGQKAIFGHVSSLTLHFGWFFRIVYDFLQSVVSKTNGGSPSDHGRFNHKMLQ